MAEESEEIVKNKKWLILVNFIFLIILGLVVLLVFLVVHQGLVFITSMTPFFRTLVQILDFCLNYFHRPKNH